MRRVRFYKRPKEFVFTRRNQRKLSCVLFVLALIVPLINVDGSVGRFTRSIFSYWTAADKDFGKLKFVDFSENSQTEVLSNAVIEFVAPFSSASIESTVNNETKIVGASDMFKAVAPGIVQSVTSQGNKKIINIDHGNSIKSIYEFEGLLCVKNGDRVEKDVIGISKEKSVILTITRNDEIVKILGISNGKLEVKL